MSISFFANLFLFIKNFKNRNLFVCFAQWVWGNFYVYNAIKTKKCLAYRGILRYNNSSRVFRDLKTFFDFSEDSGRASLLHIVGGDGKLKRELRFTERNGFI